MSIFIILKNQENKLSREGLAIYLLDTSRRLKWTLFSLLVRRKYRFSRGFYIENPSILRGLHFFKIGSNFRAYDGLWLEAVSDYAFQKFTPSIVIGNRVNISRNFHLACIQKIVVGDDVLVGSNVLITDHSHGNYVIGSRAKTMDIVPQDRELHSKGGVYIGSKVWICDNVKILANVTIGDGAIIPTGSVVTTNVTPYTIYKA